MPTSSAIYAPQTGYSVVTLSGEIETDAQFSNQPIADDQIVFPDTIGVSAQLEFSGPAGTYTLWHMRQIGTAVHMSYDLVNTGAPVLASPQIDQITGSGFRFRFQTDKGGGSAFVAVSSSPIADGNIVSTGTEIAVSTAGVITLNASGLNPSTMYYVKAIHIDADDASSNILSDQQATLASGTITAPAVYTIDESYTVATLDAGFDTYLFDEWPEGEPEPGWQLVSSTTDGYFDSDGNYYSDVGETHDFWVIEPDGTATRQQIFIDSLPFLVVGTFTLGEIETTLTGATIPFTWSGSAVTGYQYRIDGGAWQALAVSPAELTGLSADTEYQFEIRAVNAGVYSAATSVSFTTEPPSGELVLVTPAVTDTQAILPFTWSGVNATGFQYRINGGAWQAIANSPISLTGLTELTEYDYDVRAVTGETLGAIVSGSFTTLASIITTPNPFTFTPQTGAQINTRVWSNWQPVTGVSAGQDIALSVSGASAQWQYSTDGGTTASAATSSPGTVRLNYLVRVSALTGSAYETAYTATTTCGGTVSTFPVTTRADDVAPVVTLVGGDVPVAQGSVWSDPGYTAADAYDGDVTASVVITGSVNTAIPGAYTLTYTAEDAAGNRGSATRVITVVSSGTGLQVDSAPAEILRNVAFDVIVSEALTAPTLDNISAVFVGASNPALQVNSVTGSGPWTINLRAAALIEIQHSNTGYPIRITVDEETVQTEAIPFRQNAASKFVNLASVGTGNYSLAEHFTEWPLEVGHQIAYYGSLIPSGNEAFVSASGIVSYSGLLLTAATLQYRVIKPDGTLSALFTYTFQADSDVEYIRDVVPRLLATDVNLVRVFLDRDNTVRVTITHDSTAINMEQFSRFVLSGFPDDIDSDDNPEVFDVTEGNGVLDLMLGQLLTSPGVYKLRLVGYSQLHTNGVVLFDPSLVDASVTAIVMNA